MSLLWKIWSYHTHCHIRKVEIPNEVMVWVPKSINYIKDPKDPTKVGGLKAPNLLVQKVPYNIDLCRKYHTTHLKRVFEQTRKYKLRLNPEKMHISSPTGQIPRFPSNRVRNRSEPRQMSSIHTISNSNV